jgi:copper transport protein
MRAAAAVALLLLLILALPSGAEGHASFRRSDPAPNAAVRTAPEAVQIWFSEAVARTYTGIEVYDSDGARVDLGDLAFDPADPATIRVSLGELEPGAFTVGWRALSAVDGHVTRGGYAFLYDPTGTVPSGDAGPGAFSDQVPPEEVAIRGVALVGQVVAIGAYGFLILVWFPAIAAAGPALGGAATTIHRGVLRLLLLAALVGGLAIPSGVILLLAHITSHTTGLTAEAFGAFVLGTPFGQLWLLRGVAGLGAGLVGLGLLQRLGGAAADLPERRPTAFAQDGGRRAGPTWLLRRLMAGLRPPPNSGARTLWYAALGAFLLALASAVATSLSSHSAGVPVFGLAVLADFLHLTFSSLWVGGLVLLAFIVLARLRSAEGSGRAQLASHLVANFSALATVAVVLVLATGVAMMTLHVGSVAGLTATPYGWTLLAKVGMAVPLIALGARNHFVMRPRLEATRGEPSSSDHHQKAFGIAVRAEALLGAAILVAAALLTALTPPASYLLPPTPHALFVSASAGDLRLSLEVSPYPTAPGTRDFNVFVDRATPTASLNITQVNLHFTPEGGGSETILTLESLHPPSHFYGRGPNLISYGTWVIKVEVVRIDANIVAHEFTIPVG